MSRLVAVALAAVLCAVAAPAAAASTLAQHSATFAGYAVAKPKVNVRSAAATFMVPTITCRRSDSGVGPSVLVQTTATKHRRHTYSGAAVGVACEDRSPVYQAILVVNGKDFDEFTVQAGDAVMIRVHLRKSETKVRIVDKTSGDRQTRRGAPRSGVTAYVGASAISVDSQGSRLDPFTTTRFSGAEVNGRPIGAQHPVRVTWKRHRTTLISASRLRHGGDFRLHFEHS